MNQQRRDWRVHGLEGVFLRFVLHENRKYKGQLIYDWLLIKARNLGIHGGSAFHGIAGFGRHGVLHEQHFWELSGDLPVEVRFICSENEAGKLLDAVEEAGLSLFYVISPVRYGVTGVQKTELVKAMPPLKGETQ
ncbi:MAG TPA: DUF190 domain-containing protein [Gammaproteobacteria bacterium]|nr:DUF190 domain-containing protein [Gammaproteobacteria bacterium]